MVSPSKPAAMLLCIMLSAALFVSFAPRASAQEDTGSTIITDLSSGVPVTGGNFTIKVKIADDYDLYRVQFYIWFTFLGGPSSVENIMFYASEYPLGTREFETPLDIPMSATGLMYQFTAMDTSSFMPVVSNVISRPIQDNVAPVAAYESLVSLDMGSDYTFNGSTSTDNVGIANYTWSFLYGGRQMKLYGHNASHRFAIPGEYSVSLVVKDSWSNSGTVTFSVAVRDTQPPVAKMWLKVQVWAGNITFFDGTGSSDNVGVANYTWQFTHNGTAVRLYGDSPQFRFWTPGTYNITLTVSDAEGNTHSTSLPIEVLRNPSQGGESLPWWTYILIVMVCIFAILTAIILRMK